MEAVVYFHDFADEGVALEYAIASQKNRRNLTEHELHNCIQALRKTFSQGGDRRSPDFQSSERTLKIGTKHTAEVLGIHESKVKKSNRVADSPEVAKKLVDGKIKSIDTAYNEVLKAKGKDPHSRPNGRSKPVTGKAAVHPAFLSPVQPPPTAAPAAVIAPAVTSVVEAPEPTPSPYPLRELLANPSNFDMDVSIYEWLRPRLDALFAVPKAPKVLRLLVPLNHQSAVDDRPQDQVEIRGGSEATTNRVSEQ